MKYLILGAGPAGLTIANCLKNAGESSFLVIEKEDSAGGLCRSIEVDERPFDIGGGHFLDVTKTKVNNFLFSFMPESEWNRFERNSKIMIENDVINSPIEANIWQLPLEKQIRYLKSIAIAGSNLEEEQPIDFKEWIYWKLGEEIAEKYMIPYNLKMFGNYLNDLGTYWLDKLPNVSFEETLRSCLTKKTYGRQPAHSYFYYPKKYGYGELWRRMSENIEKNIVYNMCVNKIDFNNNKIKTLNGQEFKAEIIINTIPWVEFIEIIGMPEEIRRNLLNLKYTTIETRYYNENLNTKAHWIYYPNPDLPYHRILVRSNFCPNSRGYWTETRKEWLQSDTNNLNKECFINKYSYPINTKNKPQIMNQLLSWSKQKGVIGLGRWGEHQHYNSDVTVELAMKLANKLC